MNVSKRLKQLREKTKTSQNQLSKKSGVAQSAIHKIESESIRPSVDVVERLCNALGITLSEFFQEDEDVHPDIRRLMNQAQKLSPEQRKALEQFLDSLYRPNEQANVRTSLKDIHAVAHMEGNEDLDYDALQKILLDTTNKLHNMEKKE